MNKKELMYNFFNLIKDRNLLTLFIKNIFDYQDFNDYNYIFRIINGDNEIIIDIYDNISSNRFNRYIFDFVENGEILTVNLQNNVFVNYIHILDSLDEENKLIKFAYLFKIDDNLMINYANSFLDKKIVVILSELIKKPI